MSSFESKIVEVLGTQLTKSRIEILQINLGKFCNLTCSHCHVESGPAKTTENMSRETADAVILLMDRLPIHTVDLTGGAPELNPHFREFVREARKRNLHVIDRCNLTVFFEKGMQDLPAFLKENQVEVIASLPCYLEANVDKQRGKGTFEASIKALCLLNQLGYGHPDTGLLLNLVYNPTGTYLPPPQEKLEADYKKELFENFGIIFNRLYTLTNMPITRYEKFLKALGQYESYQELLVSHFNPATLQGLMCRNTLNIGWDGKLYDCDFNQMLELELPRTIFNVTGELFEGHKIFTANHCFACTAGAGSTCQGAIA